MLNIQVHLARKKHIKWDLQNTRNETAEACYVVAWKPKSQESQ